MSNIADLTRTERFEAGAVPTQTSGAPNRRVLLGVVTATLLGGSA
jgi:hypothetical protein